MQIVQPAIADVAEFVEHLHLYPRRSAERWQDVVINNCRDLSGTLLNPRRANWDPTWNQSLDNPHFAGQVAWELEALEQADLIICWLPATAQARISLMEIGLHARRGRLLIGCAIGFHSRGNVLAVGQRFDVPVLDTLPALVEAAKQRLAPIRIGVNR